MWKKERYTFIVGAYLELSMAEPVMHEARAFFGSNLCVVYDENWDAPWVVQTITPIKRKRAFNLSEKLDECGFRHSYYPEV